MPTLSTAATTLNVRPETIDRVAVISFDEMSKLLEPIASCEDVITIAIGYPNQKFNVQHSIKLSVDPQSLRGLDGSPKFFLIENPKEATSEIEQLENALKGVDLVIILVELEKCHKLSTTCTLPVIIKHIQMRCSKIVCVAKEPFHFVGVRKLNISERCLGELLEENIPVVTLDVNKFLLALPNSISLLHDANIVIDSIVSSITCDLIKRLRQTEGWEALFQIVQKSSNSQIYFDMTKKAMKPQAQFIYTLFGRCNAPVLIESMPIMIDIPTIKDHKTDLNTTTLSSWIGSLLKGYKSKK